MIFFLYVLMKGSYRCFRLQVLSSKPLRYSFFLCLVTGNGEGVQLGVVKNQVRRKGKWTEGKMRQSTRRMKCLYERVEIRQHGPCFGSDF